MKNVKNVSCSSGYFECLYDKFSEAFVVIPFALSTVFGGAKAIVRPHDASLIILVKYG